MYASGVLLLTTVSKQNSIGPLLKFASSVVKKKLFFSFPTLAHVDLNFWEKSITSFYNTASEVCPSLDVRLILSQAPRRDNVIKFDVVLTDRLSQDQAVHYAQAFYPRYSGSVLNVPTGSFNGDLSTMFSNDQQRSCASFENVCLGGTFDQLHNGHKILLSMGALLAQRSLLIGVTSDCMLKKKQLAPLIQSFNRRRMDVESFLMDIGFPSSKLELVEITDPYGPPAVRPEFDCIIASSESTANCHKLNEIRLSNNLNPVHIKAIDLVNHPQIQSETIPKDVFEPKLSSTLNRFNLLGTSLRPPNAHAVDYRKSRRPYVIGLAGPSGAGKSALARRLSGLDSSVHVVDCDKLGHEAYMPGTSCHKALLEHFGFKAIACPEPPHAIDRSRLGKLVFADARRLKELNQLVWPEIENRIHDFLQQLDEACTSSTYSNIRPIVVLDAAVLLQAGWDRFCDEVWVASITKTEAQRRICERNNLPPEVAMERLEQQAKAIAEATGDLDWWDVGQLDTGNGPIGRAHVVLSTQWEPECTQMQVEKAFNLLKGRLV